MEYTINAHQHGDTRWFSTWPTFGVTERSWSVRFAESARYTLPGYHQQNVNKLVGLAWGWMPLKLRVPRKYTVFGRTFTLGWDTPAHRDSARWGWRWNPKTEVFELLAYTYSNGERNWNAQLEFPVVGTLKPGQDGTLHLRYDGQAYWFTFESEGEKTVLRVPARQHSTLLGFTLSLYFGGKLPAPHRMGLWLKRLSRRAGK